MNRVVKILCAMKGVRSEWSTVMQAWRQLTRDFADTIRRMAGILSFLVKREAMEVSKFSKFDGLADLMHLDKGGLGLFSLVSED